MPIEVDDGVVAISAGPQHSLALKDTGEVVAWWYDTHTAPTVAKSGVRAISAGG
ncbi:RCC1 domain-containing protein [Nonomuraea sp. NPDC046802]|uniref:RCC1 domain-containing protein n=1 Tax=Nonomuraea sp. NPDC046802 TaxID=3154919 RepID=UPI0033E550D3